MTQRERHSPEDSYDTAEDFYDTAGQGPYQVLIIGAGPAGMAAALSLHNRGVENILLVERNEFLGGILKQCIHTGFGLSYFREDLTGPEYARRLEEQIHSQRIPHLLRSMVLDVQKTNESGAGASDFASDSNSITASDSGAGSGTYPTSGIPFSVTLSSSAGGRQTVTADSVLVATGCRERTRENLLIPGSRPAGVFSAGQAQDLINVRGLRIGKKVLIQGSGDIGLIMARRLTIEGYEVVAVLERLPYLSGLVRNKVQCLDHFSIPLELGREIERIDGEERVEGVSVRRLDENLRVVSEGEKYIECDAVLFSVGLIPELETAKSAGAELKNGFSPAVDDGFQSTLAGLFVCGNALHINDLADSASREGERAARRIAEYLNAPSAFHAERRDRLPYREPKKDTSLTEEYFDRLQREGKLICIICPKGCEVNEYEAGCEKGFDFFYNQKNNPSQRMATTVWADSRRRRRIPLVSRRDIPVSKIGELKKRLTELPPGALSEGVIRIEEEPGTEFLTPEIHGREEE